MVVVPSGVQFGPKSYALFQMEQACTASLIWNHKHDFRKKLRDTNFSHHFIISILESQNSIPTCRIFESVRVFIDPVLSWFVKVVKVLSFSCSLIGYFTQALKSDRLFFWWSFLICLEKYAIKSKKWCNSWIIRTDESQSDCKGHQWSQNRCNKEDYNGFLMVDHKRYWHLNLTWFLFWFFSFRPQATGFHSRITPVAWSPMSTNDLRNWSLFIAWGRGVGGLWLSVDFTWSPPKILWSH